MVILLLEKAQPLVYGKSSCMKLMYMVSCGKLRGLQSLFSLEQSIWQRLTSSMALGKSSICYSWGGVGSLPPILSITKNYSMAS